MNNAIGAIHASGILTGQSTISLPASAFSSISNESGPIDIVFSSMTTSDLFPLTNKSSVNHAVASSVISLSISKKYAIHNLQDNVTIALQLHNKVIICLVLLTTLFKCRMHLALPKRIMCVLG